MNRAYYANSIADFLKEDADKIYGKISGHYDLNKLIIQQSNAWKSQVITLQKKLVGFDGEIYFEFSIPRMGKRVDNVIIIDNCIFVIEFKIGSSKYGNYGQEQVFNYALDLNNFHEGSHNKILIPILIADSAADVNNIYSKSLDNLYDTIYANSENLAQVIRSTLLYFSQNKTEINVQEWVTSIYKPTPTIIEAATALYKNHNVEEIARYDAGAENLALTSVCISKIIDYSKLHKKKSICFVTGVPGAGKTLAGLNIANLRSNYNEEEHAVFLSGNGPLVDVLREALARDKYESSKIEGKQLTKESAKSQVKSFIQNIHHFRDASLRDSKAPIEKVTIFDEAQRAWTKEQASNFMKRNKGYSDFNKSEPEFLIEVMDRHKDWCTIICLIGGGQEINTGEAGLEEWIRPFSDKFKDWSIYYSSKIIEDENYIKKSSVLKILEDNAVKKEELHLSVSLRSFRSAQLSNFIQKLISNDANAARKIYLDFIIKQYPIMLTRDLAIAKGWLKSKAKGNERIGIIASSGAIRLRPIGLNVKVKVDAPKWFLNDKNDIRSSSFLEEVATEFDIQGLELDWTCVAWDADLYYSDDRWNYQKFKGTKWQNIGSVEIINYLFNSYRVLLTRARQGMILYIPNGDNTDVTRKQNMYDGTYQFFKQIGIREI
ncbi:hypothetical protein AMR72_09455 [Flavobacterium psychrophilum]|nr:hypothetical protein AMR72_09455 [Flavobacterium psychrophilum]AOE52713.1 hypothetical protein ALW18_09445 [Flavobacterium psychrophilum]